MITGPQILLYNLRDDERTRRIRQYLNKTGIAFRTVTAPDFLQPLGYLFEIPGFERNPQFNLGGNFQDEMLVLKDFSSEQLDQFLQFFKANGIPSVRLKAILTPINRHWNSLQLYEELTQEHKAMTNVKKL
ncbi:MAG: DUF3783 domain-containing protein [Eubacteriales bacterium]|nr:DUF3783 domain-containing protein [Eubacteriales bacterium]